MPAPFHVYSSPAGNCYGRMFPPAKPLVSDDEWGRTIGALAELVEQMRDDGSRPSGDDYSIDAGYTYFGQFLDHDLTNDPTSIAEVIGMEPEQIVNQETPRLDLKHLYGNGPFDPHDRRLYEPGDVRLRTGAPVLSTVAPGRPRDRSFDLPLEGPRVVAADQRASENIILRQVTAVFARLHNLAVEQWRGQAANAAELFARARLQMSWQFQWLVTRDFLPTVLDREVYRRLFKQNQPLVSWDIFSIPVEFSVAAMRFGHSMVRDGYVLSPDVMVELPELLRIGLAPGALDPTYEVDWGRFFEGAGRGGPATTTQPIDALISIGMFEIPRGTVRLFNSATGVDLFRGRDGIRLPELTLTRGVAMRLPSGQEVARAFGEEPLSVEELTRDRSGSVTPQGEVLLRHGLAEATPLWFYILKESETRTNGSHLGATGSHIVGETIYAALQHDPESYINHPEATEVPPRWVIRGEQRQILSLGALFEAAMLF